MGDRFRVATFNANSLRSRLEIVLNWLNKHEPNALCIQETRVVDADFPIKAFTDAGWKCVFKGQKSFNGVAIITREEPSDVASGLTCEPEEEARIIRARVGDITVVNTYIPQGTAVGSARFQYKLDWIRKLRDYFTNNFSPDDLIVWVGDFNVAVEPIDVYDPEGLAGSVCYNPEEQNALEYVRGWGFVDVFRKHHPGEEKQFSFYDYRLPSAFKRKLGWRIDHIWATQPLADRSTDCWIDIEPRLLEKPSDHTFVVADFNLS